ncbi:4-hydroxyproline epimerase [Verminephrobacter aporrectodeae subsp. tuberculatae]|uniref:4-hydroxyproline epimerase n=1 Tax=Verminephrobacter aporrectodeae subsp. tuberculatae TaxID=1110392 RepID=A0ABT3KPH3_9BURK|nr:4-hydroxyproline epimerase [Verminephrobacter aporrectodeae]MCW5220838.1 4-hydroxyproline epimerase [Verminephrobacter aporrectodeae subsp. tuberculatae]MCW5255201.1 4-hydroxyproline epimerase [Verminephrobacter aporrectodeae subsp. tuberculatae]MCW5290133.1 4-hydroxyproline epimerase [Verminephrobacter aporrectodeae subsp. tuberculatae]MCW5320217.1 4-hydroxyproline epimerase [Verminephrobacter aporrectodeae subsp. tuberculatae]MCW8164100.1 4-hydroxyproline epimerase [Verminephrobacter apor
MNHTFFCIDGHTCGNPVRLVSGGAPALVGNTMIERRAHFERNFDWIRTALMFEPRGHEGMSGTILYPPTRPDCDVAILFIEVSGCLAMCGHGTIGTVTFIIEHGLVQPREPGVLRLDTPAGLVLAHYTLNGEHVDSVRLTIVPSFLHSCDLSVEMDGLGPVRFDVAYGGNFYAIIESQPAYADLEALTPSDIQRLSPALRRRANEKYRFVHPETPEIQGLSHVMWTGKPRMAGACARNAVFYGDKAIDRSPCGTGTSARMAQLVAKGQLGIGDKFVHESIIGTTFNGVALERVKVGDYEGIRPSVEGWARVTGLNTIFVNDRDPLHNGFLLK